MKYIVTRPEHGDLEIDVRQGHKLRAEREMFARGWGSPSSLSGTWLMLAFWYAARAAGEDIPDDFDDFADQIDDLRQIEGTDAAPFPKEADTAS